MGNTAMFCVAFFWQTKNKEAAAIFILYNTLT
jgi:hypothetical protein